MVGQKTVNLPDMKISHLGSIPSGVAEVEFTEIEFTGIVTQFKGRVAVWSTAGSQFDPGLFHRSKNKKLECDGIGRLALLSQGWWKRNKLLDNGLTTDYYSYCLASFICL